MKNFNTRFDFIFSLFFVQFLGWPGLFGQISGTVDIKIDTIARPNWSDFNAFLKQGNLLFGFSKSSGNAFSSSDDGKNWSLFKTGLRDFVATDSFVFFQKNDFTIWKTDLQGVNDSLGKATWNQQIGSPDPGYIYFWHHEVSPFKNQGKNVVSDFVHSELLKTNYMSPPTGVGIYSRILKLSNDSGKSFFTFSLVDANSTQSTNQPSYFVRGDSMLLFDLGKLYKIPIAQFSNGPFWVQILEIGTFSAWQPQLTWAKNCLTIWENPGRIAQYYDDDFGPIRSRSFDDGKTWQRDTLPLEFARAQIQMIDTITFLACPTGLFRSTNFRADSFERIFDGIQNEAGVSVFNPFFDGQNIYANSAAGAVLHSPDSGKNWEAFQQSNGNPTYSKYFEMDGTPNLVYGNAFWKWSEDSSAWLPRVGWIPSARKILRFAGQLWAPSETVVYRSGDEGRTWQPSFKMPGTVTDLFLNQQNLYAANGGNLYVSTDSGKIWTSLPLNSASGQGIQFPVFWGDTLFYFDWAGPNIFGIFRSTDSGATAQFVFSTGEQVANLLAAPGHQLFVLMKNGAVFRSTDGGESWSQTGQQLFPTANPPGFSSFFADSLLCIWKWNKPIFSKSQGAEWVEINYENCNSIPFVSGDWIYQGFERFKISEIRDSVSAFSGRTGTLAGRVIIDEIADCQTGATASPFPEKIIEITPGPRFVQTDLDGNFSILLPAGNYEMKTNGRRHHLVCPDTLVQNITVKPDSTTTQLIDFQPIAGILDGSVLLSASTPARPGFLVRYQILVKNEGTETLPDGLVSLKFPAANLVFENAETAPSDIFSNEIQWKTPPILKGEKWTFWVDFKVNPTTQIGAAINLEATFSGQFSDVFPADNFSKISQTTNGSFDPNDKTVLPEGNFQAFADQKFEYQIRFQNTGNDTAFSIKVVDTLDHDLDILTLKNLSSSHPFRMQLAENHIVTWFFENILLPDSTTDERASHGFLRFEIRAKKSILPGAKLANRAAIFFDFNAPVLTNSVLNCAEKPVQRDTGEYFQCVGDWMNSSDGDFQLTHDSLVFLGTYFTPTLDVENYAFVKVAGDFFEKDTVLQEGTVFFGEKITPAWDKKWMDVYLWGSSTTCPDWWRFFIQVVPVVLNEGPEMPDGWRVFPNPASDVLYILKEKNLPGAAAKLLIFNLLGQQVLEKTLAENTSVETIDLRGLPSGQYFLKISRPTKTGEQLSFKKLIVKHLD